MKDWWDEDAVERHLVENDREALGEDFLRLTRWVMAEMVRSPAFMCREDLVQAGVAFCFSAIRNKIPTRPRMPYFAQVVKRGAWRLVGKECVVIPTELPLSLAQEEGAQETVEEIIQAIVRSEAGRTFPMIRDAVVQEHQADRIKTRACVVRLIETTGRPGTGRAFVRMLKEELSA